MEIEHTDTQADWRPIRKVVSWHEAQCKALKMMVALRKHCIKEPGTPLAVYGIPRGGMFVAALLARDPGIEVVTDPAEADIFVDDIIDSGSTAGKYLHRYGRPTIALFNKKEDPSLPWVVFPWEEQVEEFGPKENVRRMLQYIGENPDREGLAETPERVVRSWGTLFGGYGQNVDDGLKVFEDDTSNEMVVLRDVEFYSTCEHHMLPFHGKAHIAYIPDGKVIGVSKLARVLEVFARRLQIQERLCQQITSLLDDRLGAKGSACILEAQHFCMTSRGVQKQNSIMVTSSLTGVFQDANARMELFHMIKG